LKDSVFFQIIDEDPEDRVTPARWIRGKKRNAVILCWRNLESGLHAASISVTLSWRNLQFWLNATSSIWSVTRADTWCSYYPGSAISNRREPKSCLGWVFSFKSVSCTQ